MRILYDHQVTSLQDAGGISRYFFELIPAVLRTEQGEPTLLLGFERSVVPFRSLGKPANVQAISTSLRPGYQRYAINESLTALCAPFLSGYDVYHATYQRALPYIRRKALVVTHHDSTSDRFPQLFPDAGRIRTRLATLYAQAERIICISESSRRDLLHFFPVAPEKTVVIHHGFSPLPAPSGNEVLPHFDGRPYLLYVGSRATYKNFGVVLQALALQKERDLCLLAVGGGELQRSEQDAIDRLGLKGRVSVVARVTDRELAASYRHALLFVYPSLYEGFGFPPLEAMQMNCPVLLSRTSALPEICGDAAFYFDPSSAEDLAYRLQALRKDDGLRRSKLASGSAQIERYRWDRAAAATLEAYSAAIASRS